jgi:5-bromo-4-chloroindolyl phosphate hydrolysis protein
LTQLLSDRGTPDLIAGVAGGLFAPAATFLLGIPFWIAIPLAVLIFFGVRMALAPRRMFEGIELGTLDQASLALAGEVLEAARLDLDRLAAIASGLKNAATRARLEHLQTIAARVVAEVEEKPRQVGQVRRLLTYYLPAAARLADGLAALDRMHVPNRQRLLAAEKMVGELDGVFTKYADKLAQDEVEGLDLELKLLEAAVTEEQRK